MSATRNKAATNGKNKAPVGQRNKQRTPTTNKVLAQRNPAVAAVGAWVEGGPDFVEHPFALALITEELHAERRRVTEENLRRFQDEVRHRVAQHSQVFKKRHQPQTSNYNIVKPVRIQHVTPGMKVISEGGASQQRVMEQGCQESSREDMRQIRLRLAACRMIPHQETMSDLPGGKWNTSPSRRKAEYHVVRAEREVEEDEGEEEDDNCYFAGQHECPLVQQKVRGHVMSHSDKSQPDSVFISSFRETHVLWPLNDQEEVKKQRQFQFLMQRRQFMDNEREQVKENNQHRKHQKRTSRIKAEKEQNRLEEERKMERARQLAEAQQVLEERELLILERLRLEEEESAVKLQRRKKEKRKVSTRFVEALRAQMKERLSQEKLELPPLCCCASSFWESHPDTCANNCVFHNNPKAYAQALHSTVLSLDVR